ncbi:MAG: DUF1598 domain-containing protein [Planctomycetota bacterium]
MVQHLGWRLRAVLSIGLFWGGSLTLFPIDDSCFAQDRQPPAFRAATTVQQPVFGIAIDPAGVLKSAQFAAPGSPVNRRHAMAARSKLPPDIITPSKLRKVSLRRLAAAIQEKLDTGEDPGDAMLHLAGLLQVNYVLVLEKENDIVLAGPAEGWFQDDSARVVGLTTGWPTVLLADLLTAMSVFHPNKPSNTWVGCSIEPTQDSMTKLVNFNRSIPAAVPQRQQMQVAQNVVQGTREALGLANVLVFNLPSKSHMAQVMIEADYRMKLIGLGLEPPPIAMQTFFSRLDVAPRSQVQRWWFQPSKHSVRIAKDSRSLEFAGVDVLLSTEDYAINASGNLYHTGKKPSGPATAYAKIFTDKYPEIAQASPVFKQLRTMVDLLVLAAHTQQLQAAGELDFAKTLYWDPPKSLLSERAEPKRVPCVVNAKWTANRLIAASGGVSIAPAELLDAERVLADAQEPLQEQQSKLNQDYAKQMHWWWD